MIIFENVTKTLAERRPILTHANLVMPSNRGIALLGLPAEATAVVELISHVAMPDKGRIVRKARVSFPAGNCLTILARSLTPRQNAAHAARLYDANIDEITDFVESFTDLGADFDKPLDRLSINMQMFFGMSLAYSLPFDVYVVDGAIARGEPGLRNKLYSLMEARRKHAGLILANSDERTAQKYCDMAAIIRRGRIKLYENLPAAYAAFASMRKRMDVAQASARTVDGDRRDDE